MYSTIIVPCLFITQAFGENVGWKKYSVLVQIVEQDFEIESRIVVGNLVSKRRLVKVRTDRNRKLI